MTSSKEWVDYHLSPAGWLVGTKRLESGVIDKRPVPGTGVLTVRIHEETGSLGGTPNRWSVVLWRHHDRNLVDRLLMQHGRLPPHPGIAVSQIDW